MSFVPAALKNLAVSVAGRSQNEEYQELQKDFDVTAAAGVITLTDATILHSWIVKTGQLVLGGIVAKPHEFYNEITIRQPADVYHFAMRNRKIYVKDITTGLLGTCTASGTLTANRIPTLAESPDRYDQELVDEVVNLALSGVVRVEG
jgi:hypothetical protein